MSRRQTDRDEPRCAAESGPDDGADPKAFHDRRGRNRRAGCRSRAGRKARQLCEQIRDALHAIFSGLADEVLRDLTVVSVEPAPHTGRLMVTVAVPVPADATDRAAARGHLGRAAGLIRSEAAAAICRRNTPELTFRVV
jgi:ribosome-binding factor A